MKKRILGMIPHLCIIIALMLLTFFVTDRFNTAMAFINHSMTKCLLTGYLLLLCACLLLLLLRRRVRQSMLRLFLCLVLALLTGSMSVLLIVDFVRPSLLLFTYDPVKCLIAALSLAGILCGLLLIRIQRRELVGTISEASVTSEIHISVNR